MSDAKQLKKIALSDVAKHNDRSKTWLLIHGYVYDVTPFLDEHPGGEEVLLEQAGKDCSEAFEDVGHSTDARELMKSYLIGELTDEDKKKIADVKINDRWSKSNRPNNSLDSGWGSWIWPVAIAVGATVLYRTYMAYQSN